MGIRILIPAKLTGGKTRLATVLDERARKNLCLEFLIRTLGVATPVADVTVITKDESVAQLVRQYNVDVCFEPVGAGLNAALDAGRSSLSPGDGILVCPIDLPFITSKTLCRMCGNPNSILIVPDRLGQGTNLMWLPSSIAPEFVFAFGQHSFSSHCHEAERLGLAHLTPSLPEAQFDVDLPEDLDILSKTRAFAS